MTIKSPGRVFWPLASLLVLADCSSKRAIEAAMPVVGVPVSIVDGVLSFTLEYNTGAAFSTSLGPYQRWLLVIVTVGILIALARSYRRVTAMGWLATAGLALIAGGAIGNLLDRLISARGVVDFIDVGFQSSRFYVFNIADIGVSVGAALMAYALWRSDRSGAPST